MDKYGYTLNRDKTQQQTAKKHYFQRDLELMSSHQLREICRTEKIIHGVVNPLDKEELIRVILRYRGADENLLIRQQNEEGLAALNRVFSQVKKNFNASYQLEGSAKIIVYSDLAINFYDNLTLRYDRKFVGTNALVVSDDHQVCAVFNIMEKPGDTNRLYLVKDKNIVCAEAPIKNYSLYCFDHNYSEMIYRIYQENHSYTPDHLEVYRIPLLDFAVRQPVSLNIPLAIDFGTANTVAGAYLDSLYFEQLGEEAENHTLVENDVNYALFYDTAGNATALVPSVVGIVSLAEEEPEFVFGYEAQQLANASYIDEGFCVFYDIKRWIGEYEKQEEISDRQGRHALMPRKDIIKAFLLYVIEEACDRFKCRVQEVQITCPVKQKQLFQNLFQTILPDYAVSYDDMLDEGVAVLYNTISEKIRKGDYRNGEPQKALIVDCGGGTTDLCSCTFTVDNQRVAYQIDIETTYENGDTNFGGNNLTYRIMQLIKLELAASLPGAHDLKSTGQILKGFDIDLFRQVDESGVAAIYQELDAEYDKAEALIPTRFKDFERLSRVDYYKVKNNYYFLFNLADQVKKEFFNRVGTLQVRLSHQQTEHGSTTSSLHMDKWKLSAWSRGKLDVIKELPTIDLSVYDIELLLRADIYGLVAKFLERMYESDELYEFTTLKLSGQSCKIDIFADAIKEFVPGKIINFKRKSRDLTDDFELKMTCVDGALKYLKDKKYGYANIRVTNSVPSLPYIISALTHTGEEKILIHCLDRAQQYGSISRNMENLTLKLNLKDTDGVMRYSYSCHTSPGEFQPATYEEIQRRYGELIPQAETDNIVDREVKFFVWADARNWGFTVVPVTRDGESLLLGKEQSFSFENDAWVKNFFDGTN